jgi:hypothetical protein
MTPYIPRVPMTPPPLFPRDDADIYVGCTYVIYKSRWSAKFSDAMNGYLDPKKHYAMRAHIHAPRLMRAIARPSGDRGFVLVSGRPRTATDMHVRVVYDLSWKHMAVMDTAVFLRHMREARARIKERAAMRRVLVAAGMDVYSAATLARIYI